MYWTSKIRKVPRTLHLQELKVFSFSSDSNCLSEGGTSCNWSHKEVRSRDPPTCAIWWECSDARFRVSKNRSRTWGAQNHTEFVRFRIPCRTENILSRPKKLLHVKDIEIALVQNSNSEKPIFKIPVKEKTKLACLTQTRYLWRKHVTVDNKVGCSLRRACSGVLNWPCVVVCCDESMLRSMTKQAAV